VSIRSPGCYPPQPGFTDRSCVSLLPSSRILSVRNAGFESLDAHHQIFGNLHEAWCMVQFRLAAHDIFCRSTDFFKIITLGLVSTNSYFEAKTSTSTSSVTVTAKPGEHACVTKGALRSADSTSFSPHEVPPVCLPAAITHPCRCFHSAGSDDERLDDRKRT